ncbi:SEA (Seh1-associated) complex subunit [Pleosporales sp. CAS-2024a]
MAPSIPPAPPPPPPRQRQRSYFERFVAQPLTTAYAARPPSVQTTRSDGGPPNPLVPRLPGHKTGLDLAALDTNRERTHAVLAGREILKTVRVHDARIVDETNLRAAVLNYADAHARVRDGLAIHDVKWSHGQFSSHIATAAANGKVILYDLNRASVELTRLHEHNRQVHKLAFNPHQGYLLLSASQDATVRLWDLRDMRRVAATCRSRDHYSGVNGGIRDVQWSPTDAVEFAFGTDNGTIQRWDFLYNKGPKQKITAHDQRICTSIDWHPDGKHMLSSGVDRTVKVWDFAQDGRRQKPTWVLTTPYPVHKARWRPPYWSDHHHERGAYQSTQISTYYDREHSPVHVWDFRRPHLPFREINKFPTAPSDMLWHSRDTLWTVGKEGVFQQTDLHHAPKTLDQRNLQALAVSPSGEVGGVTQRRPRRTRSATLAMTDDTYLGEPRGRRGSPEKGSMRNSADDGLDDSFRASSAKRHHGRTASSRSARSFGSTPPSDTAPKVMFLTDSMTACTESSSKPNQVAFRGALPGMGNVQIFAYLAQKYKAIPLSDPPDIHAFENLGLVFSQNAEYAERASLYRLAQTWKIVGSSIASVTRKRAELRRDSRRLQKNTPIAGALEPGQESALNHPQDLSQGRDAVITANPAVRAILGTLEKTTSGQATPIESTSNLATPLARPLAEPKPTSSVPALSAPDLSDLDHEESVALPPSLTNAHSFNQTGKKRLTVPQPNLTGPKWYQSADALDERRALGSYRASPRIPLTLSLEPSKDPGTHGGIPQPLERHDSGESFTMFSASSDSQKGNSVPSSFASGTSRPRSAGSAGDKWQISDAKSSFGNNRLTPHDTHQDVVGKSSDISPITVPIGKVSPGQGTRHSPLHNASGQSVQSDSGERAIQEMEHLRRNNQLLRHDSSESEAYASSRGDSFSSLEDNPDMDASGTIVPDEPEAAPSSRKADIHGTLLHSTENVTPVLDPIKEDALLLSDYQAMHVDVEAGSAYSLIGLLENLLAFHTDAQSDAQFSSILLLLLAPLLPQTHGPAETTNIDVGEILTAFSDTFTALGLSPAQAKAVLSTQLSQLIATGINPYQGESILHTYHAQLHNLSLFNPAASLRRLSYPAYPAVYEQALKDTQLGLLCLSCKSPINNPQDKMRCESCKRAQAPCPICWAKYPAFEPITAQKKTKHKIRSSFKDRGHGRNRSSLMSSQALDSSLHRDDDGPSPSEPAHWAPHKATLWTWCSLCGHGGHTNCLSTWFADASLSDGACATEGCLCDCVRGARRDEKIEEVLRVKAAKDRAKTVRKGDDWKVKESKAVSEVRRAALDDEPCPTSTVLHRDNSTGKRVRVITPDSGGRSSGQPLTASAKLSK